MMNERLAHSHTCSIYLIVGHCGGLWFTVFPVVSVEYGRAHLGVLGTEDT